MAPGIQLKALYTYFKHNPVDHPLLLPYDWIHACMNPAQNALPLAPTTGFMHARTQPFLYMAGIYRPADDEPGLPLLPRSEDELSHPLARW
jgi:hypothetical protein